jgi:hypothetical protein
MAAERWCACMHFDALGPRSSGHRAVTDAQPKTSRESAAKVAPGARRSRKQFEFWASDQVPMSNF